MNLSPRLTALLGLGVLPPFAVYAVSAGTLTATTAAIGLANIGIIIVSLLLMFGPADGDSGHAGSAAH